MREITETDVDRALAIFSVHSNTRLGMRQALDIVINPPDTILRERVAREIAKGCNLDPDAMSPKAVKNGHLIPEWYFFTEAADNVLKLLKETT